LGGPAKKGRKDRSERQGDLMDIESTAVAEGARSPTTGLPQHSVTSQPPTRGNLPEAPNSPEKGDADDEGDGDDEESEGEDVESESESSEEDFDIYNDDDEDEESVALPPSVIAGLPAKKQRQIQKAYQLAFRKKLKRLPSIKKRTPPSPSVGDGMDTSDPWDPIGPHPGMHAANVLLFQELAEEASVEPSKLWRCSPVIQQPVYKGSSNPKDLDKAVVTNFIDKVYGHLAHKATQVHLDRGQIDVILRSCLKDAPSIFTNRLSPPALRTNDNPYEILEWMRTALEKRMVASTQVAGADFWTQHFIELFRASALMKKAGFVFNSARQLMEAWEHEFTNVVRKALPTLPQEDQVRLVKEILRIARHAIFSDAFNLIISPLLPHLTKVEPEITRSALDKALDGPTPGFWDFMSTLEPAVTKVAHMFGAVGDEFEYLPPEFGKPVSKANFIPIRLDSKSAPKHPQSYAAAVSSGPSSSNPKPPPFNRGNGGKGKRVDDPPKKDFKGKGKEKERATKVAPPEKEDYQTTLKRKGFDLSQEPRWEWTPTATVPPSKPCRKCSGYHFDNKCLLYSASKFSSVSLQAGPSSADPIPSEEVVSAPVEVEGVITPPQEVTQVAHKEAEVSSVKHEGKNYRSSMTVKVTPGAKLLYTATVKESARPLTLWFDPGAGRALAHRRLVVNHGLKLIPIPTVRIRGLGEVVKTKHMVKFMVTIAGKDVDISALVVDSVILETSDVLIGMDIIGSSVGLTIGPDVIPHLRYVVEGPEQLVEVSNSAAPLSAPQPPSKEEVGVEPIDRASRKRKRDESSIPDSEVEREDSEQSPPSKLFITEDKTAIERAGRLGRRRRYKRGKATLPEPTPTKEKGLKKVHRKRVIKRAINKLARYKASELKSQTEPFAEFLRKTRYDKSSKTLEVAASTLLRDDSDEPRLKEFVRIAKASLEDLLIDPELYEMRAYWDLSDDEDSDSVDAAPITVLAEPPSPEVLARPVAWREDLKKPDLVYEKLPMDVVTEARLRTILESFGSTLVGSEEHIPMGQARDVSEFDIELVENAYESLEKLGTKAYATKGPLRDKMNETTAQMLDQNVVTRSGWVRFAFPAFFAKRPRSDKLRLCINFIPLNKVTVPMNIPMPQVEDVIQEIGSRKIFSVMDLKSGYHQFRLSEKAKKLCHMCTQDGVFRFEVLGFGLRNAVAFFQAEMQKILKAGIERGTVRVYVDDIIIATDTEEEHLEELQYVFTQLRKHNLKAAMPKCHFMLKSAKILGHVVGGGKIQPDSELLQGIRDFPEPRSQKAVRQFLGLVNYIRAHIPNLSDIEEPLNALLRGPEKETFRMTPEAREAFLRLKSTEVHRLVAPDYTKPIFLQTDASALGAGAVLAHRSEKGELQPIAFASWSFNSAQRNYSATDRELLAIVMATRKFRPFLFGRNFKVLTDHKALSGQVNVSDPHSRIARWSAELSQYDIDIEYIRGSLNEIPDALSRNFKGVDLADVEVADIHAAAAEILAVPEDEEWAEALLLDPDFMPIIKWLKDEALPEDDTLAARVTREAEDYLYNSDSGLLFRKIPKNTDFTYVRCVPQVFRQRILRLYHDAPSSGAHMGRDKTFNRLKGKFYFPDMYRYVAVYVKSCDLCQHIKDGKEVGKAPIGTLPATGRFDTISLDLWQAGRITNKGNKYVLTVIDSFTKWAFAIPIPNKKATTVAETLYERVFSVFGYPNRIHSDQGKEFINETLVALTTLAGVEKTRTTAYHPQGNAFAERIHQFFRKALAAYANQEQTNWDYYVPGIMLAYNTAKHDSTSFTPSELMFGREIRAPGLFMTEDVAAESLPDFVKTLRKRLNMAQLLVMTDLEAMRLKKAAAQEKVELTTFKEGDQVLLYIPNVKQGESLKLTPHWTGPFKVTRRALNDKVYYLANENDEPIDHPVSINRLKPYYSRENMLRLNSESTRPPGLIRGDVSATLLQSTAIQSQMQRNGQDPGAMAESYVNLNLELEDNSALGDTSEASDPLPLPDYSLKAKHVEDTHVTEKELEVPDTPANRRLYQDQYSAVRNGNLIIKRRVAVVGERTRRKPGKLSF